jgi:hypothetical protein
MSQHAVITKPIKVLGFTNLNLTITLKSKNDSFQLLLQEKRIPRSLCIKCKLTTSPQYDNNPDFLTLKNDLQQEVDTFIA